MSAGERLLYRLQLHINALGPKGVIKANKTNHNWLIEFLVLEFTGAPVPTDGKATRVHLFKTGIGNGSNDQTIN